MKKKSEMMARLRKERADKGLVELRVWLTPEQKRKAVELIEAIKNESHKRPLGN